MLLSEYDLEKREKADIIPSPGKCIYCYQVLTPDELTDEHVIPYALAADTLILERSCCRTCQGEIARYEQSVLRHQLGAFRAQVGAPTRRMKDRVKLLDIQFVEVDGNAEKIRDICTKTFPIEQAPLIINLWQYPPAKIFLESTDQRDRPWTYFVPSEIDAINRQIRVESGAVHVAMSLGKVNRLKYQRFLAKTAHAFAASIIGLDAFEPCLLDIILNRSEDADQFVGDMPGVHAFPDNPESTLQISLGLLIDGPAQGHVVVYFQLYPSIKRPQHVIIVGKPKIDLDVRFT